MHPHINELSSQKALLESWNDLARQLKTEEKWSPEAEEIQKKAPRLLLKLHKMIRAGTWSPEPVRSVQIPKGVTNFRLLGIPPLLDRIVEKSTLRVIEPILDAHFLPWSFAFRRGLGVNDAIQSLIECRDDGRLIVLRCDIKDCFQTIPHKPLEQNLLMLLADTEIVEFISLFIKRGTTASPIPATRGLHQGAPLSPLLSNVFLNALDHRLNDHGFSFVRYADDLAVATNSHADSNEALSVIKRFLADHKMHLNSEKIQIQTFEEGVQYLGQTVNCSSLMTNMSHPRLVSLYVAEQGSLIRSKGKRLKVELPNNETFTIGFERLNNVVIFGRVGMTTPVMQQFVKRGIDLTLLSETGSYFGRLEGQNSGNPFIRQAQYKRASQEPIRLEYSKIFIRAKLLNQRTFLMKYARRYDLRDCPAIARAEKVRAQIDKTESVQALMGIEGKTARDYFQTIRILIGPEWGFEARRRRPPPDPVNSMLSFGYSLLTQEIISAINAAGLDPYMGFLHYPRIGRPSLALDLVEEFRSPIIDSLVLRLIFTKAFKSDDFMFSDTESSACLLLPEARKRYVASYERRMLTLFTHLPTGRRVTWRQSLGLQARQLGESLMKKDISYQPIIWK